MKQKKSVLSRVDSMSTEMPVTSRMNSNGKKSYLRMVPAVLVVLLLVLLGMNKGMFVAALVNGKPIFTSQFHSVLRARFGQQTLEGMIGEMLIRDEAKKAGVVVTKEDMDAKEKEIVSSLGANVSLDDLLKFQGLSKADFEQQVKLQLTVEKLLSKDVVVSDKDIDAYIATNSATLTATEPAALRAQAKQAITAASVSEKLQVWFAGLRQKAKVLRFL